jgi:hypothetical protein
MAVMFRYWIRTKRSDLLHPSVSTHSLKINYISVMELQTCKIWKCTEHGTVQTRGPKQRFDSDVSVSLSVKENRNIYHLLYVKGKVVPVIT